jgi:DNA-binding NarL/FixJ family response regulator
MIRILVADTHYLILEGLRALIRSDDRMEIIGETDDATQLQQLVSQLRSEILIMDYTALKGFDLDELRSIAKIIPVLVITSDRNEDSIRGILSVGVAGFLFKDCKKSEILDAIIAVAEKRRFYCNQALDIVLGKVKDESEKDCLPTSLTTRETEIVGLMSLGHSTAEIANQLSLSKHTVYTHRKNILKKLGLNSATEVVRYAIQTGLIRNDS